MYRLFERFLLLPTLVFVLFLKSYGQRDYMFQNYYLHDFMIFPAATGVNYYPSVGFSYDNQWGSLSESPRTFIGALNFRLGKYDFYTPKMMLNKSNYLTRERLGVGIVVRSDKNGPLSTATLQMSYAYHLPFEWATASLGLDLSYNEIGIDQSILVPIDPNDPELMNGGMYTRFLQGAFGLQVTNELFFLSLAARNLVNNKNLSAEGFYRTSPDYYAYAGFTLHYRKGFKIEPSAFYMFADNHELSWSANVKTYFRYNNWIAINYCSSGILEWSVVLHLIEQIQVGYGYAYYFNNLVYNSYGAHTIFIGRNFGLRNLHGIRKNTKQLFL